MSIETEDSAATPMTLNPLLAFWAMPFIMTQAWMTSILKMGSPQGFTHKPRAEHAPAAEAGQIPMPTPIEEDHERQIFA